MEKLDGIMDGFSVSLQIPVASFSKGKLLDIYGMCLSHGWAGREGGLIDMREEARGALPRDCDAIGGSVPAIVA